MTSPSHVWFTADFHLGHKDIIEYCGRPFKTVEEHDEAIIANWNAAVKLDDEAWFLGDFAFGGKDRVRELTALLNGNKHIILGNHDEHGPAWWIDCGWKFATPFPVCYRDFIWLSHEPIFTHHACGPYINFHGHVHNALDYHPNPWSWNLSVDVTGFKPVSLRRLLDENGSKNSPGQMVKISKHLSYVLRHKPESIHLSMDSHGWVSIEELIGNSKKYRNIDLDEETIREVVETNDKQRFEISPDGKSIRASQGHSIDVDLDLSPQVPPDILYHGTAVRFMDSITREGLKPMSRQFVHLSLTGEAARSVGKRHGKAVVLLVDTKAMCNDGYVFYLSRNQVWLTKTVPVKYISTGAEF